MAVLGLLLGACGDGDGIPAFDHFTSIAIADLNDDHLPDLATANVAIAGAPPHPSHVTVSLQKPGSPGEFARGVDHAVGSDSQFVTAGDLNGDDLLDLLATNYGDGSLSWLEQIPAVPGSFLPEKVLAVALHPDGSVVADVDGDGVNDVVTSGRYVTLLINSPGSPGRFTSGGSIDVGGSIPSVTAGDIDGDGRMDLALADPTNDAVVVLIQDAPPAMPGRYSSRVAYPAGHQPFDVELADLDGDSKLDLVVANLGTPSDPDSASASVLIQSHDPVARGEFLAAVDHATGARSQDVAVGDLDGNGLPDLAVANAGHVDDDGSLSILFQDTAPGVFRQAVEIPGISQPLALAIGDLDSDGLNDIAMADGGATVLFQETQNPGTFRPAVWIDR